MNDNVDWIARATELQKLFNSIRDTYKATKLGKGLDAVNTDMQNAADVLRGDIVAGFKQAGKNIGGAIINMGKAIKDLPTSVPDGIGKAYDQFKSSISSNYNKFKDYMKVKLGVPGASAPSAPSSSDAQSGGEGGGFLSGVLGSLGGGLKVVGDAALSLLKSGASAAISGAMQREKEVAGLSGLLGKGGANAAYKNINTDSNNSTYDMTTLLSANKALISVDGDAKRARVEVMNLANAVSAAGGGGSELLNLSEQMKEIKSEGSASSDQLKQFGAAGIDIYGALSSSTGKSIEQLKGMNITYDMLAKSLADSRGKGGMFEGGLESQSNTVEGKLDIIKKTSTSMLTEIGTAFMPLISRVLEIGVQLVKGFEPLMTMVQPYIDSIVGSLGSALDFILNLGGETNAWGGFVTTIQEYFSTVWSTLGSVFDAVWSIVSGLISWIANSELIKDVFAGIYGILGIVLKVIGWVAEGLKWVWNNILSPILDGIESAYRWAKELITGEEIKVTKTTEIKASADLTNNMQEQTALVNGFLVSKGPAKTDLTSAGKPTINRAEDTRKSNTAKSQETGDTVSGGGQKTINITLGKFFDTIQFNTLNSGETSDQLESVVMECLGRVLYNGAKVI
ncbi:hypothetical protein [Chryseobacterium vrystaatense]|uniref:Tape measure domain-containing protein n=1 Tax=Chryseobacterium vrystaatense TaxID=307480 RepID=A0A1M5AN93_9FLAO|nr:hypothetical protein [Chryseobacterium vrystaatense]SHF31719.1 hypothetical protein SAMN02787073_1982 [Chryseobacterium vrystaatense]